MKAAIRGSRELGGGVRRRPARYRAAERWRRLAARQPPRSGRGETGITRSYTDRSSGIDRHGPDRSRWRPGFRCVTRPTEWCVDAPACPEAHYRCHRYHRRMPRNPPPAHDLDAIIVPGTGRTIVEPDIATVRLGVAIVRPTASDAREAAAATMSAVLEAVAAAGVGRRDVRTTLVGLSPVTDYSSERGPRVTGYQVSNTVEIIVRDLASAGELIDAGLRAGASSLDGLEFRLDDPSSAEDAARKVAIDDARRRAAVLAEAAGVSVGRVVGIVEGDRPQLPFAAGGTRGILAMKSAEAADTPVEGGSQEVVVSVVVTFAIG